MPRTTKDSRLDTSAARSRLPARRKPHYRLIEATLHIGYYKGSKLGGTWVARRYVDEGRYATGRLGLADDGREADGTEVLTFTQAQAKAREWATQAARKATGAEDEEPWTVARAVAHYLDQYEGKARSYVETTFRAHVLPALGDRLLKSLTTDVIRYWHRALANAPARVRTKAGALKRSVRAVHPGDDDAKRARRSTANSVLTLAKAALNLAYRDGKVASDATWRRVKPFREVDAPRIRYLTDDEATRLTNACPPDLRNLVTAALLTGCRYQEIATLRPVDVDLAVGVVTVRADKSKSSRTRAAFLTEEGKVFFEQMMAGKSRNDLLFQRDELVRQATRDMPAETRRAQWGKSHQFRPLRDACKAASITPAISFHILRHTHASRLAMRGVPLQVIAAQLGHASVKMTERHYTHLAPSYVAETIRNAFGSMGLVQPSNVTALRPIASSAA